MGIDPQPPWPNDAVGQFVASAKQNIAATAANCSPLWNRLRDVDAVFATAADNLNESKDWFAALFLMRSHAAYRATVRLAASGQIPEAFVMMRSALEYALYGRYVADNPARQKVWMGRSESLENRKALGKQFTIRNLVDEIKKHDPWLSAYAEQFYDTVIDYGAHPNGPGLWIVTAMHKDDKRTKVESSYLQAGGVAFTGGLQMTARVGITCLMIFGTVFRARFDILGLTRQIEILKESDTTLG